MNKIVNRLRTEKSNEGVDFYSTKPAQETKQINKQTNKQNNLLTLTVSRQKINCITRSKKKKTKP